jgi:hypothetical protein
MRKMNAFYAWQRGLSHPDFRRGHHFDIEDRTIEPLFSSPLVGRERKEADTALKHLRRLLAALAQAARSCRAVRPEQIGFRV